MTIEPNSYNLCMEVDAERIKRAKQSLSERAREARIDLKALRKEKEEEGVNLEG